MRDMRYMIYPKPVLIVLREVHFHGVITSEYVTRFNETEYPLGDNVKAMEVAIREHYDSQAKAVRRVFQYYPEPTYIDSRPCFARAIQI